jgi:hypothetical protein
MYASQENRNTRERSAFGRLSLAKGLLCPDCKRAVQIEDVRFRGSDFQITCGDCRLMLLAVEE